MLFWEQRGQPLRGAGIAGPPRPAPAPETPRLLRITHSECFCPCFWPPVSSTCSPAASGGSKEGVPSPKCDLKLRVTEDRIVYKATRLRIMQLEMWSAQGFLWSLPPPPPPPSPSSSSLFLRLPLPSQLERLGGHFYALLIPYFLLVIRFRFSWTNGAG